jgi:hypothetical protein
MKSRRTWLPNIVACLLGVNVSAQELVPGDRVRLSAPEVPDSRVLGKMIEVRPGHLVVPMESHYSPTVVRRARVRRFGGGPGQTLRRHGRLRDRRR